MTSLLYKTSNLIGSVVSYSLVTLLIGLRPLLGPAVCRYEVGCTQFAVTQLQTMPLIPALWAIGKRILSCNPLYRKR